MPRKVKAAIILATFLIGSLLTLKLVEEIRAASFSVSYNISFTYGNGGSAKVVQKITLKNLTEDLYASEYSLNIGSTAVTNVSGKDSLGAIKVTSKKVKNSTVLAAKLNDKVIGKNKITNFTLFYTINNLSTKKGRMWETLVPGISTSEKLDSFILTLNVPKSYDSTYSIYPKPKKSKSGKKFNRYIFDKKETAEETVIANFGNYQVVEFSFKYKLKNPNFFGKEEKILIPPDTTFQEVYFSELNPRPSKIDIDKDGNYFALFELEAGEEKEVIIKGFAKIDKSLSKKISPLENKQMDLSGTKFWQIDSLLITKEVPELEDIGAIYKFVTEFLTFNEAGVEEDLNKRLGAAGALANPDKALASEFVDLFIAITRAKNIPARQVVGFAFGDNTSLTPTIVNGDFASKKLHTWVEYFDADSGEWVQVDPTWGATRQVNYLDQSDANHFALFERSTSSENPKIPKLFGESNSSFEAKPVDKEFNFAFQPKVDIDINETISGFPTSGKVIITNEGGKSLRGAKLQINTSSLDLLGDKSQDLGTILPFSQYIINFKVRSSLLLKSDNGSLEVVLSGLDQGEEKNFRTEKEILIKPFFSINTPQIVLILLLVATLSGVAYPLYKKFKKTD